MVGGTEARNAARRPKHMVVHQADAGRKAAAYTTVSGSSSDQPTRPSSTR